MILHLRANILPLVELTANSLSVQFINQIVTAKGIIEKTQSQNNTSLYPFINLIDGKYNT